MAQKKWISNQSILTNADQTLRIGDIVDYEATGTEYKGRWVVIGATDEGELLILSENIVDMLWLYGSFSYNEGIEKLNDICEKYGKGKGATGARSITIEDVEAISALEKFQDFAWIIYGRNIQQTSFNYWLATKHIAYNKSGEKLYCFKYVSECQIKEQILLTWLRVSFGDNFGVRAIVSIKPDIQVKVLPTN